MRSSIHDRYGVETNDKGYQYEGEYEENRRFGEMVDCEIDMRSDKMVNGERDVEMKE